MKSAKPWILGISASPHNGAACLLKGDEIFVAIQEERLVRRKREPLWAAKQSRAIAYCLDHNVNQSAGRKSASVGSRIPV